MVLKGAQRSLYSNQTLQMLRLSRVFTKCMSEGSLPQVDDHMYYVTSCDNVYCRKLFSYDKYVILSQINLKEFISFDYLF